MRDEQMSQPTICCDGPGGRNYVPVYAAKREKPSRFNDRLYVAMLGGALAFVVIGAIVFPKFAMGLGGLTVGLAGFFLIRRIWRAQKG